MKIIQIYKDDYPENRRIQFKYSSNYYYILSLKEKDNGWNVKLVKTIFEDPFIKNIEENLFEEYKKDVEYYIAMNDYEELRFISFGPQKWNNTARLWEICVYEKFQR